MLSTPGGTVREGLAVYNLLRALPIKVHTYNVGSVNSIGNVIYLAGERRLASPTSSFMFHGVGIDLKQARLEEKNLKELTDSLKNDQGLIAQVIVRHTNIDSATVDQLFLAAAFIGADDAKGRGIVHDVSDIQVPQGAPFVQLVFQG
jgi:ATP-dependent protease ClpP protease subunit